MRIAYFGSGDFGLPTLKALSKAGHDVCAVYTQPDQAAGRGRIMTPTPIKAHAVHMRYPVMQPETLRSSEPLLDFISLAPDLAVVVAYGHLIPDAWLPFPKHGFVNLHASLLPAFRGAAPVPWAIISGEKESGVTIFRLNGRFDEGVILKKSKQPILPDDTSATLLSKLSTTGAELMLEVLHDFEDDRELPVPQNPGEATRAPKLKKESGFMDWREPLDLLERKSRAFQPWPLAHTELMTAKGLIRVNVLKLIRPPGEWTKSDPGTILAADTHRGLVIQAGDAPARLVCIQPQGKKSMNDVDFLRGTKVIA